MGYGDKVKVSILETNGVDNFDGAEERELTADITDFDNTATVQRKTNVADIIKESTKVIIWEPEFITATLNGTTQLLHTNNTLIVVYAAVGVTGYTVKLPDATGLFLGRHFQIVNGVDDDSFEEITIEDFDGNILATLLPSEGLVAVLEDNGFSAGHWIVEKKDLNATGILNYNISSSVLFSTDNVVDTLITGMAITPISGKYAVWFSSDINIESNNDVVECVVYTDGVAKEDTRRKVQGVSSNFKSSFYTVGTVDVDGTQAVDVRVKSATKTVDVSGRTLILIRLGAI